MTATRKILTFFTTVLIVLASMLLLAPRSLAEGAGNTPVSVSNKDYHIGDGTNWSGDLTGVDFDLNASAHVPKDFSPWYPSTWGLGIDFTVTVTGNFDVSVMNATTEDPSTFYEYDFIDTSVSFDFSTTIKTKLGAKAGATVPLRMKGNFTEQYTFTLTWIFAGDIISNISHDEDYKYTSLEPINPEPPGGTEFKAFFGNAASLQIGGFSIPLVLDPVLSGHCDISGGVWADTTLARDEWPTTEEENWYPPNNLPAIHSCTEKGELGCLKGYSWSYYEDQMSLWAQVTSPIFGDIVDPFEIVGTDNPPTTKEIGNFVQSLTWQEQIKYQDFCDHIYYQVPVAAWLDHEKTRPAKGVFVYVSDLKPETVDSNVQKFTVGKTGSNPDIPDPEGRVNIYLPWKDGKYTIAMDPTKSDPQYEQMSASAEQPENMEHGMNARVNLYLGSLEKIQYNVDKSWDIDLEYKDKPDCIEVLLQAQYDGSSNWTDVQTLTLSGDNNWSGAFDEVSKYEIDSGGHLREIPYRVRELEEEEEGSNKTPGERVVEKSVTYTVPAYTNLAGEEIAEHKTKYNVTYKETKEDDNHRKMWITNLAVLDFTLPKVWMGFDDEHPHPDSVYIALCYRVDHNYLEQVKDSPYARVAETWIPVFDPLSGDMIDILSLLDLDWIEKVDPTGITKKLKIPLGIGIASDSNHWKLNFTTRKYEWTVVPGIPVEFKAMELTSAIVTDLVKLLTGFDIPLAPGININPGSDGTLYLSVPIAPMPIPGLNRDWDRYGIIMNIYAGGKGAIGGAKIWVNDTDDDRPEKLFIHVKDPDNPDQGDICQPIQINKSDFPDTNPWLWYLSEAESGVTLDPDKTYIISESFDSYEGGTGSYACEVDGYNLTNTKGKKLRLVVNVQYQPDDPLSHPSGAEIEIRNRKGESIGDESYTVLYGNNSLTLIDGEGNVKLNQEDLGALVFTGSVEDTYHPLNEWSTKFDGPETSEDDDYITYTYTMLNRLQENVELHLVKVWNGPAEISVDVYLKRKAGEEAAEEDLETVTLSGDTSWEATVKDLKRYAPDGEEYIYFVEEEVPTGYRCDITESTEEKTDKVIWNFTITNTSTPLVDVKVTKTWDDDGDSRGLRPNSLWIQLMVGDDPARDSHGDYVKPRQIESPNWQYTFKNLPLNDEAGNLIPYRIVEIVPQQFSYTPVYADPVLNPEKPEWTCNVTNTLNLIDISVLKVWDDQNDVYRIRPDSVEVTLNKKVGSTSEAFKSAVLNQDNNWFHVFQGLPTTEGGESVTYYVTEDVLLDAYTTTIKGNRDGTDEQSTVYQVINTLKRRIQVVKNWEGDALHPEVRPQSVTVTLHRNDGYDYPDPLVLSEGNGWQGVFTNNNPSIDYIPNKNPSGAFYVYSLKEVQIPGYYTSSITPTTISGNDPYTTGFTLTNIYNSLEIPVVKLWADDGRSHQEETVNVVLYRDSSQVASKTLSQGNGWQDVFTGLLRLDPDRGVPYIYTLTETDVPSGYDSSISPASISGDDTSGIGFTVTNTLLGNITVTKKWEKDDAYWAETRPDSVKVWLTADGEDVDSTELTAAGSWQYVFENRPLYRVESDGSVVRINYNVKEEDVPPGYEGGTPYQDPTDSYHFFIPNTLILTDISVQKVWSRNPQTELPSDITVILLSNWVDEKKQEEVARATITGDPWIYTFKNQPVWRKGREIKYSVAELPVPGYQNPVISLIEGRYVIRNVPDKADVWVFKSWEDEGDAFGTRPRSVTFALYCNGTDTHKRIEVSADTHWAGAFHNLERKSGGILNVYTVRETKPVDGYTTVIEETETPVQREYGLFVFHATNILNTCTITYDPNGGIMDGSTDPVSEEHLYGEEITIRNAPMRDNYYFTYWKGSEYHPGDKYTVTGDHTFVAQWMREDPRVFKFTFTKEWIGKAEDSLSWTLYYPDGTVRHKAFKKKVVSDTEWEYTAWFDSLEDYYLIEDVPPHYRVRYSNIGIHADETDRLYNGGTVYNYYIPKTDDRSGLLLYLGAGLLGCGLLVGVLLVRKRKRSGR